MIRERQRRLPESTPDLGDGKLYKGGLTVLIVPLRASTRRMRRLSEMLLPIDALYEEDAMLCLHSDGRIRLIVALIVILAASPAVGVELEDPGTFEVNNTWTARALAVPVLLGGILFSRTGDILYVVGDSERAGSALYAVPVTRDPASNEVIDLGTGTIIFNGNRGTPGLAAGLEFGPEGTFFYTYWPAHRLGQRSGGFQGPERLFNLSSVGVPSSLGGLTFSPYLTDPNTNFRLMQVTTWSAGQGDRSIYNVPLIPLEEGFFQPQPVQRFVTFPATSGIGQFNYIPSGPDEGNLIYAHWGIGEVDILAIDPITGFPIDDNTDLPVLGTDNPKIWPFAWGMGRGPWALAFDPITNDLFLATINNIASPPNSIIQITGFPPPAEKPSASFAVQPESGEVPLRVDVDASASNAPDGTAITTYEWDFGDGDGATGVMETHTYTQPGRYLITLLVANDKHETSRTQRFVDVVCPAEEIAPWKSVPIGEPQYPGSARFEGEGEERCLRVCGGGREIRTTTMDEFHFVYRELAGDVTFTARISELVSEEDAARVGVMLRESLAPGARYVAMLLAANSDVRLFYRQDPDKRLRSRRGAPADLPNVWIRIRREGNVFIASSSNDGTNWTEVNKRVTLDLPEQVLVGIAASGIDSRPYAGFQPLLAKVCNIQVVSAGPGPEPFHRGDADDDGRITVTDAVSVLNFLFSGGRDTDCKETQDFDNDGRVVIADAVGILSFLFGGGPAPAPPGPTTEACGPDPDEQGSPGDLGCNAFNNC